MTKLTKTVVERTPLPTTPGGQTFVWCSETRGFGCRINEGGSRTYIAQGRVNGRERRVSIGRHGVFTVDQARDQAQEILRSMRLGVDPVEAKAKEQAQGVTLRETIADYVTHKRTKNGPLRPRTKADIQYHADKHFADWMDKPVRTITRKACAARFADISKTAPATANQAFVILRGLLNFARDRYRTDDEPLLPENPVDVLKRTWHPTKARSERVPNDKMGAVWVALDKQRTEGSVARGLSTAAAFVQFQLLTGARWGEAAMLTWDRVDLDGKVPSWRLEDDQAKNGIGRTLPLSSQAVVILKALPRKRGNDYVFVKRGDKGHIGDPRATYELVSKIAGLHVSSHSMRRTFGLGRLLNRVLVFLPIRRERPLAFETCVVRCIVDCDNANTDRRVAMLAKLGSLVLHIRSHTIQLLDHRFRKDLHFCAQLDLCHLAHAHRVRRQLRRYLPRDSDAEGSVTSPMLLTDSLVRCVQDKILSIHRSV